MVNKVILIGNLGADPEVKNLESGTTIASLNVATTQSYKDKQGEWQQQTEWHSCVLWSATAEQMSKYHKGSKVYIEGQIKYQKKDDKTYTSIRIDVLRNLSPKTEGGSYSQPTPAQSQEEAFADPSFDKMPF